MNEGEQERLETQCLIRSDSQADVVIRRDGAIPLNDRLQVLSPYFKHLSDQASLLRYFQGYRLGHPLVRLVYWKGQPAAHWSLFPFPYWMDGKPVVIGKPEGAAVHPEVAFHFPRPDVFGMAMKDLITQARDLKWSLLVALTTPQSRLSHYKHGFRDVEMPIVTVFWPLHVNSLRAKLDSYIKRRYPRVGKKIPATLRDMAVYSLAAISRILAVPGAAADHCVEMSRDELVREAELVERNYWAKQRVTAWREPDFLRSRLQPEGGYKIVGFHSRGGRVEGIILLRFFEGTVSVLDILPPNLSLQHGVWQVLLRLALRWRAEALIARLYLNNPIQVVTARMLRWRLFPLMAQSSVVYSVLALDPTLTFAYEVKAWAGTEMLTAGF